MIINCNSFESSLETISEYYNVSSEEILKTLRDFDMDEYYKKNNYEQTGDRLLYKIFNEKFSDRREITEIHWFHLTRMPLNEKFKGALKPLGGQIEQIWEFLYLLAKDFISETNWNDFKNKISNIGHSGFLYKLKASNSMHWGPYAMLIKEVAFRASEIRNHDYLKSPEIIEDICHAFESRYKVDLLKIYSQSTVPCIVHFRSNDTDYHVIEPILFYLYKVIHNEKFSVYSNTCFDGKGREVPASDVLKIELV
ncbi:hypothetical protein D3C74_251810 [compost metagenome]